MKPFRLSALPLALLAVAAAFALTRCGTGPSAEIGAATVRETTESIITYPFSDPDPVPIFARSSQWGNGARLYPYHYFTGFSGMGEPRDWTVVRLENPYISVAVLPQVGGKVWGATDKGAGRDFLYTNHVLKFREIALRGPWTSGGIEFNFGVVGHAPSTATPVDYFLRTNADGSASCFVGTTDLPSRTRWTVEVKLPKDKAYFETRGFWYNPGPFHQSYYYWSCAAIPAAEDLRYVFPGRFQIGHDYNQPLRPWPVDEQGRDLAWYRNNDFGGSKSYFTVGGYADFYGAWYKEQDAGFGHWALYDDMPGRKIWIWDESRAGEIWVDLLTDADGQYSEPQAGRLLNQSDHESFPPSAADNWREIWFPYRGIGPMSHASPAAALGVEAADERLKIALFALERIDADLAVLSSENEILRERVRLAPSGVYRTDTPLRDAGKPFTITLGGRKIYESDPRADDLERPFAFKPADESTADGLFQSGQRAEKGRYYDQALEKYLACLARDPLHIRALTRTAELYARRGEYATARDYAAKALARDTYDPEANLVYGTVARRLGALNDAKETFGWAARSMAFRSAAFQRLAETALAEGDCDLAVEYAQKSIDASAHNSGAYEIVAAAQRKAGRLQEARAALAKLLDFDPLDHLARFELYLLDRSPKSLADFQSLIRNELPHETYIEAALAYMRLNLDDDARAVLECAPEHPTVCAMLAFFTRSSAPEKSDAFLDKVVSLSPQLVFPFREEEIPLYQWASERRPQSWKPKYYLGLILWSKGRVDEARKLFAECDAADDGPFFLARAQLFLKTDPDRARADYERAVRIDGKSWRTRHALTDFLARHGNPEDAYAAAREAAPVFPGVTPVQVDLVKAAMETGRFDEAAAVLETVTALPFEGASEIHSLYARAHLALGVKAMKASDWTRAAGEFETSKEYPERLGTGKPFDPDDRLADYLAALAYGRLGEKDKAERAFRLVADYTLAHPENRAPGAYAGALALRRIGETGKAAEILRMAMPPAREILELLK
jgi:tetratricopeptide (TPR) repeat protein